MLIDTGCGWVEPDIVVNGRLLTFAECMAVRVAISSMRLTLASASMRKGLGLSLARGYDTHLASVERRILESQPVRCKPKRRG